MNTPVSSMPDWQSIDSLDALRSRLPPPHTLENVGSTTIDSIEVELKESAPKDNVCC